MYIVLEDVHFAPKIGLLLSVYLALFVLSAHAETQTFSVLFSIGYDKTILFLGTMSCLTDSDDDYLMAGNFQNGWFINLYAYYGKPEQKTDNWLSEVLTDLLKTFKTVLNPCQDGFAMLIFRDTARGCRR